MKRLRALLMPAATAVLLGVVVATGVWRLPWEAVVAIVDHVHGTYGVDVPLALALFGIGEAVFCLSIAMLLRETGSRVSWGAIHSFKLKELNLGSPRMLMWLWVNRASWVVPWLVVLAMSLGRVPWWVTVAGLTEVGVTLALGILVTAGLRLPWWNSRESSQAEATDPAVHVTFRIAKPEDSLALAAFEREVWGEGAATGRQLRARVSNCPEGNIMAIAPDGRICGFTSYCLLDYDAYAAAGRTTWNDLSGYGTASTHDPEGKDLFGINLGVAGWAPKGTSTALMMEVLRAGMRARVRKGVLGARMPGYHRWASRMPAQEYWKAERRPGVALDPELRYYLEFGMHPVRLVEEYFEDPASLNWGVIVEMPLPWYVRAAGPLLASMPSGVLGRIA